MSLELQDLYSLSDLLTQAHLSFKTRDLRQISFVFHPEMSYIVELMDAKTNRLRYYHLDNYKMVVQTYYTLEQSDIAMQDYYRDVRLYINKLQAAHSSLTSNIKVELYPSGIKTPIVYKTQSGGYRYTKI